MHIRTVSHSFALLKHAATKHLHIDLALVIHMFTDESVNENLLLNMHRHLRKWNEKDIFSITAKPVFIACPLLREFREPGKFAKITGCENLNTVAFQCSRKQKCQNYGVQNN